MTAVTIRGLEALRRRLAATALPQAVEGTLQAEAEALAEEARREAPGKLGATVEIIDQSRGMRPAYAVGTAHRAGRFLEFGTVRRPATPWLWPIFRARSRGVKHELRKVVTAAFKTRRGEV
jgi:HK97 gp10 family phage protein